MYNNKKILAVITARGGSKGLPNKNIKMLLDKPLIAWTIESAQHCPYIDRIIISTDSKEIAQISEEYNQTVPFLRPAHLALDTTPSVDVVEELIQRLEMQNEFYDYILLLQPTSPLRKKEDLSKAIEQALNKPESDALISLGEVHSAHPDFLKKINNDNKLEPYIENVKQVSQRQAAGKAYFSYGYIYLIKKDIFMQNRSFYTEDMDYYMLERWQCYEIDDIFDFMCIEAIMKEKLEEIQM